ncbi:hypothetical protein [Zavarzinella formosa]|uniref:hypothetical protein n=1 Tax=Zavarzinella formosa TaxID=360055 RepID=UPI000364F28A|nr:hypothetical protein [Zavarzinella formosa]
MEVKDWITLAAAVISLFAAGVSVTALILNRRVSIGQAETALRTSIRSTRQFVNNLSIQLADIVDGRREDELKAADKRRIEAVRMAFMEAIEENLNAYEDACAKYVDGKIDRTRFKKNYFTEIRNLCECPKSSPIYEMLNPESTSRFRSVWGVYHEWFNQGK